MADYPRQASGPVARRREDDSAWGSIVNLATRYWKFLILLAIAGMGITFAKAMDGKACGTPFNVFNPNAHARLVGCFIRSVTNSLPDNITTDGAQPIQPANGPELINPGR